MILLVTGGSASGKSEYAENRACQLAKSEQRSLIYLAAMQPFGEDAIQRIERHRQLRAGKGFETVERYTDIEALCNGESVEAQTFREKARHAVVMLECMSNLTANEMFSEENVKDPAVVREKVKRGIQALAKTAAHLVIVSINVFGEDWQPYDAGTQAYIQCLGTLNQDLTQIADEAVEVVYTIPVVYKEAQTCNH